MIPRIEQKLELSKSDYLILLKWLKDKEAQILYPERIICSRYFDNLEYAMYRDTQEGIVPRKKIRIRTYNTNSFLKSSNPYNLETKLTTERRRYKSIDSEVDLNLLLPNGIYDKDYGMCFQLVDISYSREYFSIHGCRLTIDKDIKYHLVDSDNYLNSPIVYDPNYVVEIKANIDTDLTFLLNQFEFPRSRFSKYERALDSLL